MKTNNKITLGDFKDKHYGVKGTKSRDDLDWGYENFKLGVLLHEARLGYGVTQV